MQAVRPPAVAGLFYPAEREVLAASVERFVGAVTPAAQIRARAVIVPHAGYVYSGPVAAHGYAAVAPWRGVARRVVVAGPAHRAYVRGVAIPSVEAFATPLGTVPLEAKALQ